MAGGEKMVGWIELAGVIFAAVLGAKAGRTFSRLKSPYWGFGYVLPLTLIFLLLYITVAGLNASKPVFRLDFVWPAAFRYYRPNRTQWAQ